MVRDAYASYIVASNPCFFSGIPCLFNRDGLCTMVTQKKDNFFELHTHGRKDGGGGGGSEMHQSQHWL